MNLDVTNLDELPPASPRGYIPIELYNNLMQMFKESLEENKRLTNLLLGQTGVTDQVVSVPPGNLNPVSKKRNWEDIRSVLEKKHAHPYIPSADQAEAASRADLAEEELLRS